jgi:ABC-2 type transport system ATP-binding protein
VSDAAAASHAAGRGTAAGPGGAHAANGPGAPFVAVEGLRRNFGDLVAVDGLSFRVARGELFGLVGPDGAGKTTTLRMLAGVLRPTAGDATIAGRSVARDPEAVKLHLAYMSQRFGLYTDLTVRENLLFYADLYRVPRRELAARLERLFAFSGLAPFQGRLAGQLSGGMKQKLGLSCALVHEPELLLLDEPTFGVDPVSRRELWRIVHERVADGVTAIVSTAYLDEAERFDRVALIDRGRLLAVDTPAALQASLGTEVLEVRGVHPRRSREALLASGLVHRATAYGDRLHVEVDPPGDRAIAAVAAALAAAGAPATAVEVVPASLEDVFIALVEANEVSRPGGSEDSAGGAPSPGSAGDG